MTIYSAMERHFYNATEEARVKAEATKAKADAAKINVDKGLLDPLFLDYWEDVLNSRYDIIRNYKMLHEYWHERALNETLVKDRVPVLVVIRPP